MKTNDNQSCLHHDDTQTVNPILISNDTILVQLTHADDNIPKLYFHQSPGSVVVRVPKTRTSSVQGYWRWCPAHCCHHTC